MFCGEFYHYILYHRKIYAKFTPIKPAPPLSRMLNRPGTAVLFFNSRNIAFRPRSIFFESSATCSGLSKLGTQGKTRLHTGNIEFNTFLPFTCHKVSNNKLCPLLFPLFWAQARGQISSFVARSVTCSAGNFRPSQGVLRRHSAPVLSA